MELKVRNSLYTLIYRKGINSHSMSSGQGVNIIEVDVKNIQNFFWQLSYIVLIPLQIFVSMVFIIRQLGNAA